MWIYWKYIRYYVCTIFSRQSTIVNIFSCDQVALGTLLPVLIRPSVCDAFFTMFLSSYHHEFVRSYYHWQKWCPCKRSRSKVKVTEVKTHLSLFLDCNSSLNSHMIMKWCKKLDVAKERCPIVFQGHPSNFKVTQLKNRFFYPNWTFPDCNFSLNSPMATK